MRYKMHNYLIIKKLKRLFSTSPTEATTKCVMFLFFLNVFNVEAHFLVKQNDPKGYPPQNSGFNSSIPISTVKIIISILFS
jgi:hypothetical protein